VHPPVLKRFRTALNARRSLYRRSRLAATNALAGASEGRPLRADRGTRRGGPGV